MDKKDSGAPKGLKVRSTRIIFLRDVVSKTPLQDISAILEGTIVAAGHCHCR